MTHSAERWRNLLMSNISPQLPVLTGNMKSLEKQVRIQENGFILSPVLF
ncbi:MAG: hypothetical protein ACLU6Z_06810 [Odoribacter splanchnicus]